MSAGVAGNGFRDDVRELVRRREVERQLLANQVRKATLHVVEAGASRVPMPKPWREFSGSLSASLLAFWLVGWGARAVLYAPPVDTFAVCGLLHALQATYHRRRLAADPSYRIPGCGCAGGGRDRTANVLRSDASAIAGIPVSVIGGLFYTAIVVLVHADHARMAAVIAVLAVIMSAYLTYVMVARIGGLCSACLNTFALNLLLLWQLASTGAAGF